MNPMDDDFEEYFTQAFSTETLQGCRTTLVGLSSADAELRGSAFAESSCGCDCGDESRGMDQQDARPISPEGVLQQVRESEAFLAEHLPWVRSVTAPEIAKRMRSWIFAEQYGQGGCWGIFPTKLAAESAAETACDNPAEPTRSEPAEPTCGKEMLRNLAGFIMAEFNLKNRSATFSYWLFQKYTGGGLMCDAVKTLSRYCLDVLKLNRLELSVSVLNEKSAAVALRCGFREEGVSRDFERINGIFVDHRRFSLLSRDGVPRDQ